MSTEFVLHEQPSGAFEDSTTRFSISEQSTVFDLSMQQINRSGEEVAYLEVEKLTAEQIVDVAMKMLQPTLYHVADPKDFMENVIKRKLAELFV
jgi:hypothetical protein